jgi:hypothetical protein
MTVMDYRTRDGLADYGFSIDYEPDRRGWRVYIIFQSFHQGHDGSLPLPYQSIDDEGRRYVDWPEKLNSLGEARIVAALWAEVDQRYQRTQEQRALYVEMIERYQRTQERRRATPAAPAESSDDVQESESNTQTAASAASAIAARAGGTTATSPANSATRNIVRAGASDRHCNRRAAGASHLRRSTRGARRHR